MAQYQTRQKEAILAVLTASRGTALSATALFAELKAAGHPIGRTTVYRLLGQLSEAGLVRAFSETAGAVTLYELCSITDCADVRCRGCEKTFHLHCQEIAAMQATLRAHLDGAHGFLLDPLVPLFTGLCPGCRQKANAAARPTPTHTGSHHE